MYSWNAQHDNQSIAALRSLSVDQVQSAGIGHIGLPLGMAPVIHTLYSRHIISDPTNPTWINRDRFVLSAGHGSALLYGILHLAGYDLTIDDLKDFRQWGSRTPGHPEVEVTPGVDATTGPLGQGIANAVGMAIAETMAAAKLNSQGSQIINHRTFALVSDGDLMEGVALEAIALAGRLQLGKLIALYDDNDVVIDGRASQVHDAAGVCSSMVSLGWNVIGPVDAQDISAIDDAISQALKESNKPSLIRVKSRIGEGSSLADTPDIHSGAVSAAEAEAIKRTCGEEFEKPFAVPQELYQAWSSFRDRGRTARAAWEDQVQRLREENSPSYTVLQELLHRDDQPLDVHEIDIAKPQGAEPIRKFSGRILDAIAQKDHSIVGGSADLVAATFTHISQSPYYGAHERGGRNIAFGIREHAMGAIANGIALHGLFRPFTSTFLVFSSYQANALRMAALQNLPVLQIFTHDTIAVGEDGPTHQPVETLSMLRATPNLVVLRPADFEEALACWQIAMNRSHGPTALILARGAVETLDHSRQQGDPVYGGYTLSPASSEFSVDLILVGSGHELNEVLGAAKLLRARGLNVSVVSMPSQEVFFAQTQEYQDSVLLPHIPRFVVEASHPLSLWRVAGSGGAVYGVESFGASAPPEVLMQKYGFTSQAIAEAALAHSQEQELTN